MDVSTNLWQAREQMEKMRADKSWGHNIGQAVGRSKRHDALVKQTRKWVAQTFFGPILKQMREDPFHSDLLDGGRGGQAFYELYDQELTSHLTRGTGSKLINAIVNRIEAKNAYAKQSMNAINSEREGADRVHVIRNAEANLSVATRSSNVPPAF